VQALRSNCGGRGPAVDKFGSRGGEDENLQRQEKPIAATRLPERLEKLKSKRKETTEEIDDEAALDEAKKGSR
jgi:hypothetical protein